MRVTYGRSTPQGDWQDFGAQYAMAHALTPGGLLITTEQWKHKLLDGRVMYSAVVSNRSRTNSVRFCCRAEVSRRALAAKGMKRGRYETGCARRRRGQRFGTGQLGRQKLSDGTEIEVGI